MTQFDLSPGFIKVRYDDSHRPHYQTLPVIPDTPVVIGTEPSFVKRTGGTRTLTDWAEAWADLMKVSFTPETTIVEATFWSKPTPEDDPVWVYSVALGIVGTATGTETFTRQVNRSFRTSLGHLVRVVQEGVSSVYPNDISQPLTIADAITLELVSNDDIVVGRDGGYPVAPLNYTVKTNDALRKKELGL